MEHNLAELTNRIDQDDITVTTIHTTDSDRKLAAKALSNSGPMSQQRYSTLTTGQLLDAQDVNELVDKMKGNSPHKSVRFQKQVSLTWN